MSPRLSGVPAGAVDSHAHVFIRGLPLAADKRYAPAYDAPIGRYRSVLDGHGVSRGVLVQPSFLGTDNGYLLEALRGDAERLRGVAVVAPTAPRDELAAMRAAGVRGVRLNLIGRAPPDVTDGPWPAFLERLAELALHLEIQAEGAFWEALLPTVLERDVTVVVDHFGRPRGGAASTGFRAILAHAATRRVYVKLSAPYRFDAPAAPLANALHQAFGPDRLMWGSDWPWTQHEGTLDYAGALALLDDWLPDEAVRRWVLRDTAAALFGFPEIRGG